MTRNEFIATMQAYVEELENERKEMKAILKAKPDDNGVHHFITKIGHEISAINNAIREMQRQ